MWSKVDKNGPLPDKHPELGPCWIWTGTIADNGYGVFALSRSKGKVRTVRAHRAVYERVKGPIPTDPETGTPYPLDHFACDRLECVNPGHTRPTTQRENVLRSETGFAAKNLAKTHCPQGHEYTPRNTYVNDKGWRQCRACARVRAGGNAEEPFFRMPQAPRKPRSTAG